MTDEDTKNTKKDRSGCFVILFIIGSLILFFIVTGNPYTEYGRRIHAQEILNKLDHYKDFYEEHNIYPTNAPLTEIETIDGGHKGETIEYELSINFENNVINIIFGEGAFGEEAFNLTLIPKKEGSNIIWDCKGGSLPAKYRPQACY